ncbi:unnamed protein product [Periconia digitata]|uniref:Glutathione S-transferase n=1 Tax=Periconia digitata TaxID=1303443 RepID=A0A9W4U9C6_9PLEO|nr:unnamed protein product [Periconia digitata]
MSLGTFYTRNPNPRSYGIIAVAKILGLEIDVKNLDYKNKDDQQKLHRLNSLDQVPVFVGSDDFVLTECIAIALYVTSHVPTTSLLGKNRKDDHKIQQWMSFANSDLLPAIGGIILPLLGLPLAVRKNTQDCLRALHADFKLLEQQLQTSKYLVGDEVTLADYFTAGTMVFGVFVFHHLLRERYPRVLEWFLGMHEIPEFKEVVGELRFMEVPVPALEEDGESLEKLVDASSPSP